LPFVGAAPFSPLELELLEELVVDFPQSHESDFELSSLSSSFLSQPDVLLPEVDELELEELDDEELLDDDELLLLDDEELDELLLEDELLLDSLGALGLLLPQLSLVSSVVVSVPVDVLPQPSSETVSSSPVSS